MMKNFAEYSPDSSPIVKKLNRSVLENAYSRMLEREGFDPELKFNYDKSKLESVFNSIEVNSTNDPAATSASYLVEIIKSKPFTTGIDRMINEKLAVVACELFLCMNGHGEVQTISNDTLNLMVDLIATEDEGIDEIAEIIRQEIVSSIS